MVGANFYAFCNYGNMKTLVEKKNKFKEDKSIAKGILYQTLIKIKIERGF